MGIYIRASLIVLLFTGIAASAQNTDSLKRELTKATSAEARCRILLSIGQGYDTREKFDTSLIYAKQSAQASSRAENDSIYMEACGTIAHALRKMGQYTDALLYNDTTIEYARRFHLLTRLESFLIEKSSTLIQMNRNGDFFAPIWEAHDIALATHDKKGEARIYWVLAIYYDDLDNHALGLNYVNQAIAIYDSLKMYREVADGYRFLTANFLARKKWKESLHYAGMADSMYAKLGNNRSRNAMKNEEAIAYRKLGDYQRAISLYQECLDSCKNDEYMQMLTYSNLGIVQSLSGSFATARISFAKALSLNKEIQDPGFDVSCYNSLSGAFLRIGQVDSALFYSKMSEKSTKNSIAGLPVLMELAAQLRDIYEKKGDLATALTYDKSYTTLQDSMYRSILQNNLADAETRFNLTEKNKALSALSAENELQRVRAQKQKLLNISLLIGLCLGGFIVVLIITAYRRTLKQNRLLAEQKQELQQQKQELQQQKDIIDAQVIQLASASKMKSKFLANISHELRTPVTLLNGMLEMMSGGKKQEQTKEKERLDIAYNNSRKLQQMVEEILDLTKLENNKSEVIYEIREIAPLVRRIVYAFETLIEKEQLVLEYDDDRAKDLYISVDAGKFEKVMNNLVYNAIKFNKKGGHIKVSLYPGNNNQLYIEVTDSGIGIANADLPHIFEHFYQGETLGLKAAGAGIGLSLVKEFTTLMGGKVDVHSRHGEGTTFTLRYNLTAQPVAIAQQYDDTPALPVKEWNPFAVRQKVLIVEDNAEMRYYLQDVLGEYVEITTAGNGHEGLECLERSVPDLIISDVMMPGMDGREFVNRLKADNRFKKIPVITLTALADMETQLSFLRLGVDDYMVKPFNAEELRIRVYNLLVNQAERKAFSEQPAEPGDVQEGSQEAEEFRKKVTEYVLARIKNINVSVTDLAYELAQSERQLYRLSKSLTGYTPAQLVKEIRLQKAYELLLSGDIYKIDDVCRRVGYEKASYFAQQFYERFGKRPSEFL